MSFDFFNKVEDKECSMCGEKFSPSEIRSFYGKEYCGSCLQKEKQRRKQERKERKRKKPERARQEGAKDFKKDKEKNKIFQSQNLEEIYHIDDYQIASQSNSIPYIPSQPTISDSINIEIGNINLLLTKEVLKSIFEKIWKLDKLENPQLDSVLDKEFQQLALQTKLKLDIQRIFNSIERSAYFILPGDKPKKFSFQEWQREFKSYTGKGKMFQFPRAEFSQFLKNKYKNHWVKKNGFRFTDEEFQVLTRAYREKKAIERLIEYIGSDYFSFVEENVLKEFLRQMRMIISKIIKDELLNIIE